MDLKKLTTALLLHIAQQLSVPLKGMIATID